MADPGHRTAPTRLRPVLALLVAVLVAVPVGGCGSTSPVEHVGRFSPYVALGDSYSASPPGSSAAIALGRCQRSDDNYPALVRKALGIETIHDRTCGGARTRDLTHRQQGEVAPQLDGLTRKTRLVTIGIGAVDFSISVALLVNCPAAGLDHPAAAPCRDAAAARSKDPLLSVMPELTDRVVEALEEIHRRAPRARVLVVGYPQIVPASGRCAAYPAGAGDYPYLRRINSELNAAVQRAAARTDDTFIDVWAASAGHDVCSDEPWISPYDEQSADAAPLHPLPAEQQAVAGLIESALTGPTPTAPAS